MKDFNIQEGDFDSVGLCKYNVPSVQAIGQVYQRLIINIVSEKDNLVDALFAVFNSCVYYSNPEYLKKNNEKWKINFSKEFTNAILGGMFSFLTVSSGKESM